MSDRKEPFQVTWLREVAHHAAIARVYREAVSSVDGVAWWITHATRGGTHLWMSVAQLSVRSGYARSTLNRAIAWLQQAGFLVPLKTHRSKVGRPVQEYTLSISGTPLGCRCAERAEEHAAEQTVQEEHRGFVSHGT